MPLKLEKNTLCHKPIHVSGSRMMKILTTLCILAFCSIGLAAESVVIDSLLVRDDQIYLSYHISDLLSEKGLQALERGITSEVVHHIQLWRKKGFINPLEKEYIYSIKIVYDSWERKYRIVSEDENRLTSQMQTVKEKCTVITDFPISKVADLEQDQKYFISISVTFQPISAESYTAISDIFTKDEKKQKEEQKDKKGYFGVLVNLLGFGDKEFSVKSRDFTINDTRTVKFVR